MPSLHSPHELKGDRFDLRRAAQVEAEPIALSRVISARQCIPIRRTVNIADRSIRFSLPAAWPLASYSMNPDFWTGSESRAPTLGASVRSARVLLYWQKPACSTSGATTHWNWASELAQDYPRVTVDPEPIYVRDGNCYTSAGVTAGIDLCLALVEEDLGRSVALAVAQMMVVLLRRPAGQSQFSATLAAQTSTSEPLGDLLAWLPDNIRRHLSVTELARHAAMSPRNFARLFRHEVGKTPGRHIEDLRLEAARRHLESTSLSLDEVADVSGFASAENPPTCLRAAPGSQTRSVPNVIRTNWSALTASLAVVVGFLSSNALADNVCKRYYGVLCPIHKINEHQRGPSER